MIILSGNRLYLSDSFLVIFQPIYYLLKKSNRWIIYLIIKKMNQKMSKRRYSLTPDLTRVAKWNICLENFQIFEIFSKISPNSKIYVFVWTMFPKKTLKISFAKSNTNVYYVFLHERPCPIIRFWATKQIFFIKFQIFR